MFTRNSNSSKKTMMACKLILMPFTKEAASLNGKPGKPKLHLSPQSSLTSEKCIWFGSEPSPCWFVDIKFKECLRSIQAPKNEFSRGIQSKFTLSWTMIWILLSVITDLIIKITISSLVIGLKMSNFPLIRLPSCYRTVCYWIVCYWTVCYRTV